jgi:hypothetical protein
MANSTSAPWSLRYPSLKAGACGAESMPPPSGGGVKHTYGQEP